MIVQSIFFYLFSFIAIVSAIMVTVSRNTVHSVFFFICVVFVTLNDVVRGGGADALCVCKINKGERHRKDWNGDLKVLFLLWVDFRIEFGVCVVVVLVVLRMVRRSVM